MSVCCCSPPPADLLPDDLLQVIFLRLPTEPDFLFAASLVCRRWRRVVRSPAFLRRFRAFHRTPPVLGFFQNLWTLSSPLDQRVRFVPTAATSTRFSPPTGLQYSVLDCFDGRVLLYCSADREFLVWDPMAGDTHYVSAPPDLVCGDIAAGIASAAGHDDLTDCHSSPFQIVLLNSKVNDRYWVTACVYSSESGTWGDRAAIGTPSIVSSEANAHVGSSMYWKLDFAEEDSNHILEFQLHGQRLGLIELPEGTKENYMSDIHVMPAEDGGIGFSGVNCSSIHLWSRKIDSEGMAWWALLRIIDMDKLTLSGLPVGDMFLWSSAVAFARDSEDLFLQAEAGIFTINLRSMQLRKVLEASGSAIYPYASFYTRGMGEVSMLGMSSSDDIRENIPILVFAGCDIVGIDDRDE